MTTLLLAGIAFAALAGLSRLIRVDPAPCFKR
jgi:hypothetical protein